MYRYAIKDSTMIVTDGVSYVCFGDCQPSDFNMDTFKLDDFYCTTPEEVRHRGYDRINIWEDL